MTSLLANARHIVIKVGSSLVTDEGRGLDRNAIAAWADQIARLRKHGKQVILVSSGAVAEVSSTASKAAGIAQVLEAAMRRFKL